MYILQVPNSFYKKPKLFWSDISLNVCRFNHICIEIGNLPFTFLHFNIHDFICLCPTQSKGQWLGYFVVGLLSQNDSEVCESLITVSKVVNDQAGESITSI